MQTSVKGPKKDSKKGKDKNSFVAMKTKFRNETNIITRKRPNSHDLCEAYDEYLNFSIDETRLENPCNDGMEGTEIGDSKVEVLDYIESEKLETIIRETRSEIVPDKSQSNNVVELVKTKTLDEKCDKLKYETKNRVKDELNSSSDQFQEVSAAESTVDSMEDFTEKARSKITCPLCGVRYISQLKYDFHTQRHALGNMDAFVCPHCGKESMNENLLWDHYSNMHKSTQRYICVTCGKLYSKQSKLKAHQGKHVHFGIREVCMNTDENGIAIDGPELRRAIVKEIQSTSARTCALCGELVTDLDPDAIHDVVTCASCEGSNLSLMVDSDGTRVISRRQYHCSKCFKHFSRKERLEFHELRHNENTKECICSSCGKEFSSENALFEHYLFIHKGARPYVCELCGKSFQLKARLKEHLRSHTGERPFECEICKQRCMTKNSLDWHRKTHFDSKLFSCQICKKTFKKKQNMNEHLEKHWQKDKSIVLPLMLTCPVCSETFPTFRYLKIHMIEAHEIDDQDPVLLKQKPWHECDLCSLKFKHQMSLKTHRERIHEGRTTPVYNCEHCNVSFKLKKLLRNHVKSKHKGEKRYMCAQCGKGFNESKSMYNHILIHTGKKPFLCDHCGMAFRRKDSRDQHHRRHTGEQPYTCRDCGQKFSTTSNRAKHRKREHKTVDYSICAECGEPTPNPGDFRVHLNRHLGEKLERMRKEN